MPEALRPVAYLGEHVPLAPGRVLLDPRVFAKLLDALNVGPRDLVLDVGCGLGYSTAVLARMAEAVVALEEDPAMARGGRGAARRRTASTTRWCRPGRSRAGVPEHGPFDAILVEGAIEALPEALAGQLKPGGRIAAIFVDGSARPGAARHCAPTAASPGGVSSMQRRRCCRASRRRKRLSFERDPPDSAGRKPGQRAGGASRSEDRDAQARIESASAGDHARRGAGAGAGPAAAETPGRRAGQGLPDQPAARRRTAPRCAASTRACRRRGPTAGRRSTPACRRRRRRRPRTSRKTSSTSCRPR